MQKLKFENLQQVHIVGACGTLMGAFAAFLRRRSIQVTGSDQNIYPPMSDVLRNAGVELFSGYSAENIKKLSKLPELVVIGNVIRADNPEAVYAQKLAQEKKLVVTSLPEAMSNLMLEDTTNIVVAGTHGKTTTSSMMAHVLNECQKSPSYFIGGVSQDLPFSFNVENIQKGNFFVLEGDEYDTAYWDKVPKFNHYKPNHVILTSVEFDHADIYKDISAVEKAFEGLIERVRPGGKLIYCSDYSGCSRMAQVASRNIKIQNIIEYGKNSNEWTVRYKEAEQWDILKAGKRVGTMELQLPGEHNALNALAVYIEAISLGLNSDSVLAALKSFKGVKRRQEVRGEKNGIIVMDDFAHHPTAVRETLKALKKRYAQNRLVVVFEPRSATSRRKIFQKEYAGAFSQADLVFIASPYDTSKIPEGEAFSSLQLVDDINSEKSKKAFILEDADVGVQQVHSFLEKGDLVAILSNGGFGGFIPKLLEMLNEESKK